jgi:hypothetical protein
MGLITTFELVDGEWKYAEKNAYELEEITQDGRQAIFDQMGSFGLDGLFDFSSAHRKISTPIGEIRQWLMDTVLSGKTWMSTVYCEDYESDQVTVRLIQTLAFEERSDAMLFKLTFGGPCSR